MRIVLSAALAVLLACSGIALADQLGSDWMSKSALKKQMQAQGYSGVVVEADDGHWEGEAIKNGRIYEFHADAHTGRITKSQPKIED